MVHYLSREGPFDSVRIDMNDKWERRYWARIFGVSEPELREASMTVGSQVDDLRKHFSPVRGHKPFLVWSNNR